MPEYTLSFHPSAESEALGSYQWYAQRNLDAADAFQDAIEQSGRLLLRNPSAWPSYLHGTQKYVLKHFPFTIVFRRARGLYSNNSGGSPSTETRLLGDAAQLIASVG